MRERRRACMYVYECVVLRTCVHKCVYKYLYMYACGVYVHACICAHCSSMGWLQ